MIRALFVFALIIAVAQAFVTPATQALSAAKVEAPQMSFDSFAEIAQSSQMIASNAGDFGGALFPVFGLATLGAIILVLAPPLRDD
ncbi:expressed unknown protein [Seminavis robusta]|uniref:Uncharacterized protein n=1 Tax=Seminavis robusta TaxID=568900 RepID=A0A9N8E244_9STRA|nr:expressed unknown protein [Seminavis robusta]|eukprot:Sro575_g169420.1 n/a (86) ;mRNA; f:54041-54437